MYMQIMTKMTKKMQYQLFILYAGILWGQNTSAIFSWGLELFSFLFWNIYKVSVYLLLFKLKWYNQILEYQRRAEIYFQHTKSTFSSDTRR